MAIVAGVDFGTLSIRVSLVDSDRGLLDSAIADYPLHRKREDPEYATQSHADHMKALASATREVLRKANVRGDEVEAIALDTTGSSVIPVGNDLKPLGEYYLWCDHRAKGEAAEITEAAHREGLEAIQWCGGIYSSEWGFSKLLHWLRNNPDKRSEFVSALEHCDMVAATLCGITDARQVKRSVCAMGHKWLWNAQLGGLPPEDFLIKVDPLLTGRPSKTGRRLCHLRQDRWASFRLLGRTTGPQGRNSHTGRRFRCSLGRDRRRMPNRRHGQRHRNVDLHHRDYSIRKSGSGCLRRGSGQRASSANGNRGRALRCR